MRFLYLLLLSLIIQTAAQAQATAPRPDSVQAKTAVAVMAFGGTALPEAEAAFLSDRFMLELQKFDVYNVLERQRMQDILREQGFQQTGACDETSCLVEAGRLLPVEKMIGGSVGKVGDVYSAQVRLIDLKTGKLETTVCRDYPGAINFLLTTGMRESAEELVGRIEPQTRDQKIPLSSETQAMVKQLIETQHKMAEVQYENQSKSELGGMAWSLFLPGAGHFYAKKGDVGAGFATVRCLTFIGWVSGSEEGLKKFMGYAFVCSWAADILAAPYSVSLYNKDLKSKLGLSLRCDPRDRSLSVALGTNF